MRLEQRLGLLVSSALLVAACGSPSNVEAQPAIYQSATPIPLGLMLGCKLSESNDQGLSVAQFYGGNSNSVVVISNSEGQEITRERADKVESVPYNPGEISRKICVYNPAQ